MGYLRTPRPNMRDQKLKNGDFGRPRPNMGDQKSPKLYLELLVSHNFSLGLLKSLIFS